MLNHAELASLRTTIRKFTHADEKRCVESLLLNSRLSKEQRNEIVSQGSNFVSGCRQDSDKAGLLDLFMQEYSLSSTEGVALMCLAESLLRVPDKYTADKLIAEKINSGNWGDHKGQSESLFVNASTWGLMLTGKLISLDDEIKHQTGSWVKKVVARVGEPVVRNAVRQAMKIMGEQYVLGRNINEAIKRGKKLNTPKTRFSFDILGEGARTQKDADKYFIAYRNAIVAIGAAETQRNSHNANGISVKLSALHPRYEFAQQDRVMRELMPKLIELAKLAKSYGIGFTIDAEEAARLDISLTLFQSLLVEKSLEKWHGLGLVIQAYGKRAPYVIDWLTALCKMANRKITVRLVKGAYWDSEIKIAQEEGYSDYPVFTRKVNTDLSYQVCAQKLLDANEYIFPQFATHNAYSAALVLNIAKGKEFELQRLHGMGDLLHLQVANTHCKPPVRVYAPVGAHKDLLPYLVRRLLENGANSSFVNRFLDKQVPVDQIIEDIQSKVEESDSKRHDKIPLPENIFTTISEDRPHTHGVDLTNPNTAKLFCEQAWLAKKEQWSSGPIINGEMDTSNATPLVSPVNQSIVVGNYKNATPEDALSALQYAHSGFKSWNETPVSIRRNILNKAADLFEEDMSRLCGLIALEAGRTLVDGIAEVRETVDFLRYYSLHASKIQYMDEQGGSVESFSVEQQGRGVFFCISPWNFPLAIFVGQIAAALATGNAVLAKPAETTPLIAAQAIHILIKAGIPKDVLHLLPGDGALLGEVLNTDPRISGIVFTGSTTVATSIYKSLLTRTDTLPTFIAETGGQNAMLVDSSALAEQVVDDAVRSAFLSAGQRCSALRVLYLQEDIADHLIEMLIGAMEELSIGAPWQLNTDVGPVINSSAQQKLSEHVKAMKKTQRYLYACELPSCCENGHYVAPHLFEIDSLRALKNEVFGPVLHVIRYARADLNKVLKEINDTGYGLTLGIHSRVESYAATIIAATNVGNNYINRNMVGAVPGVNPFGGQGLSGTGPKAGGPFYLTRFIKQKQQENGNVQTNDLELQELECLNTKASDDTFNNVIDQFNEAKLIQRKWQNKSIENRVELLTTALDKFLLLSDFDEPSKQKILDVAHFIFTDAKQKFTHPWVFPGPTGEENKMLLTGKGLILCADLSESANIEKFITQLFSALVAGNAVALYTREKNESIESLLQQLASIMSEVGVYSSLIQRIEKESLGQAITTQLINGVAFYGNTQDAMYIQRAMSESNSSITPLIDNSLDQYYLLRFVNEKTVTNNIVATGGNTMLLSLGE